MLNIDIKNTSSYKQKPNIDDNLEFGTVFTDHMFIMDYTSEDGWKNPRIEEFKDILISPAAMVFHYGQSLFEGMKAYKTENGNVQLFRPLKHIKRANNSAKRLCMPQINEEDFLQAIKTLVDIDREWIPQKKGAALYIRPFMIATDPSVNVKPATKFKFIIILSPVFSYYKEGLNPVKIWIEDEYVRAIRGGIGEAKTGGNYAAAMLSQEKAHESGFSQVLWLDGIEHKYIEEVGAMNIFFKIDNKIITPSLSGSILDGVTRRSVIELCRYFGYEVEERKISVDELEKAAKEKKLEEVFGTGTAAVISPVGTLKFENNIYTINSSKIGILTQKIYDTLTGIQSGKEKDIFNWIEKI